MNWLRHVILPLLLAATIAAVADNFVALSVGGGYTLQADKLPLTTEKGGLQVAASVSYEYRHELLLLSTGLELATCHTNTAVQSTIISAEMIDTEGEAFLYEGVISRRQDRLTSTQVRLPVLVGADLGGLYLLAGLKPTVAIASNTRQSASLLTQGDYHRFYEPVTDMPQHGFEQRQLLTRSRLPLFFTASAYAEVGYSWLNYTKSRSPRKEAKYRIAVFAEYQLLPLTFGHDLPLVERDLSQYMSARLNYVYQSEATKNAKLQQLTLGIKFTYLIGERTLSLHCRCQ